MSYVKRTSKRSKRVPNRYEDTVCELNNKKVVNGVSVSGGNKVDRTTIEESVETCSKESEQMKDCSRVQDKQNKPLLDKGCNATCVDHVVGSMDSSSQSVMDDTIGKMRSGNHQAVSGTSRNDNDGKSEDIHGMDEEFVENQLKDKC